MVTWERETNAQVRIGAPHPYPYFISSAPTSSPPLNHCPKSRSKLRLRSLSPVVKILGSKSSTTDWMKSGGNKSMFADDGAEAVIGVGGGLVRTADGEGAVRFGVAPEPGVAGAVAPCPMPWFGVAWPGVWPVPCPPVDGEPSFVRLDLSLLPPAWSLDAILGEGGGIMPIGLLLRLPEN